MSQKSEFLGSEFLRYLACESRRISGGHLVLPKITYFWQNQVTAGSTSAFVDYEIPSGSVL